MSSIELVSRDKNIARIKANLSVEEVKGVYNQLYREFNREIKVSGFRKGKVPSNVIRQRMGAEIVDEAAEDQLKKFVVSNSLGKLNLTPRHGDTEWHEVGEALENQTFAVEFSIPVLPEVALPDYAAFELTVPALEVTDDLKQRYKDRLKERFTEFPDAEGAAGDGKAVKFAFSSKFKESGDSAPFQHDQMLLIIGKEGNLPGWDEQLAGKSAGDSFEFDYEMPEDFADPRVKGKGLVISIGVSSVHSVVEPPIDEEFIKKHLHLDKMEEFEEYVTLSLTRERDGHVEQMKRELAMQKLVGELQVEITADMVESEIDGMVKENDNQLRGMGSSITKYLKEKGQELSDYRDSLREAATQKIKMFLAVRKIAEEQKLSATNEDFQRYALSMMQQQGITPEQFGKLLKHEEFINEATYQIIREKVFAHVANSAKFEAKEDFSDEKVAEEGE